MNRNLNSHVSKFLRVYLCLLLCSTASWAEEEKYTISGYIKDKATGEVLIGGTIYVEEISAGAQTNVYGFYSLTLPSGEYTLEYRYIGYVAEEVKINLNKDETISIELSSEDVQLEEIVIKGTPEDQNVTSTEMSTVELDIKTIRKVPAFLGEVDVIKSIQLLPGVSTVGEGASGFNVRGGSVGQNLVLLDEAPVYNSSHLLGFFSVFNPDAVKDVKLYKGGIPARYGGRIASILDIRMKDGNAKKFGVQGGVGTIFSRLAVEGPTVKDKGSFILAGRRSYIDILAKPFTDVLSDGAQLNFYDLTLKTNYKFNKNNTIFLSGYLGRDKFLFEEDQGFSWGNKTATVRWNHLFGDRLFSNFTAFFSDYDYQLAFGETELDKFEWNSRIRTINFKPEFTYFINSNNELTFGGDLIYYKFNPANAVGVSNGVSADVSLEKKYGFESALFIGNETKFSNAVSAQYGLRLSDFHYLGPGNVYEWETVEPGKRKELVSTRRADKYESIANYTFLEPRISLKIQTGPKTSIKMSYNRMSQYIHLISNTTASNPLDVWRPSTNNIKPQIGDQYALGVFKNFGPENDYEVSVEGYYRDTKDQIEYIDGADILINEFLEADLLSGIGRAMGLEFYLKKNTGKLNGWISYTLGKSELKVDGINNFEWYPARFDQRHNLKIVGYYELSPRWTLSANFTYLSGTPTTFPTDRFTQQEYLIPYNAFDSRNNVRIPNFHRLDVSATLYGKKYRKNGKLRKNRDYWVFGFYNLYARKNPFSIYFSQGTDRPVSGQPIETFAKQVSIIGTIIPAISYNFNF
ncbi:MAG: TonB-dependent receptor [Cytophagales bacterium]|nr:TonB-dependent receptor [Cytophagales bacterium]